MINSNKQHYIYRILPCSLYDLSGIESWLSYIAAEGFILNFYSFVLGFAIFAKSNPLKNRISSCFIQEKNHKKVKN